MSRPAVRMPRWLRVSLYVDGALSLSSGLAWLALHYGVGAGRGELPHALELPMMQVHGLAAFAGAFVLGALAAAHVPDAWRLSGRRGWTGQRDTGIALCTLGAVLGLTGYGLYYFAPETLRPALGWAHALAGVAASVLVTVHRRARAAGRAGRAG